MLNAVYTRAQRRRYPVTADRMRRNLFPSRCVSVTIARASSSLKFT